MNVEQQTGNGGVRSDGAGVCTTREAVSGWCGREQDGAVENKKDGGLTGLRAKSGAHLRGAAQEYGRVRRLHVCAWSSGRVRRVDKEEAREVIVDAVE